MNFTKTNKVIYTTKDYQDFKKLLGNRDVTEERVNAIVSSIRKIGYMTSPIIVNKSFEIIDGQGRFEACKILGLPIEFVIESNAGIEECIAMNIKMKNWKTEDFIKSYADRGFKDYQEIISLHDKYPYHSYITIAKIMKGTLDNGGVQKKLKDGTFSIDNRSAGLMILNFLDKLTPTVANLSGRDTIIYDTLTGLVLYDLIDLDRMVSQFIRYSSTNSSYMGDVDSCLDALQYIYNYNKKTKIRFKDKYITIADSRRVANLNASRL